MSVFTETTQPYELLVRWNANGEISGAHVGFIERTFKDGVEIAHKIGDVMPVGIGAATGFPLADILEAVHIDALIERDAAISDKNAAIQKLNVAERKSTDDQTKIAELEAAAEK